MQQQEPRSNPIRQAVVTALIALAVGGTAPWWWKDGPWWERKSAAPQLEPARQAEPPAGAAQSPLLPPSPSPEGSAPAARSSLLQGVCVSGNAAGQWPVAFELEQLGERVTGRYFQAGQWGQLAGELRDGELYYRWTWGSDSGHGLIAATQWGSRGTWGYGEAAAGGGIIDCR